MAIKVLEIHHHGIRIDAGEKTIEDLKNFYTGVLGLEHDTGRPDIRAFPACGSTSARWARSI